MSWEIVNTQDYKCACGEGNINISLSSNDWNQTSENATINCRKCKEKYLIEENHIYKHAGDSYTKYFLIDKSLVAYKPKSRIINPKDISKWQYICYEFNFDQLIEIKENSKNIKSFTQANDIAKTLMKKYKRAFGTQKYAEIQDNLSIAIDKYGSFDLNKDKYDQQKVVWQEIFTKNSILIE